MPEYRVGHELISGHGPWPEVSEFNFYDGGYELMLRVSSPTRKEVRGVKQSACEFALVPHNDVLFFLFHFRGGLPWSDAPYSWHLTKLAGREAMPVMTEGPETRALLQVVLLDAPTGIVKVLRAVSLSPEFTMALHDAIRRQASAPWPGSAEYNSMIQEAYRKWPTTEAMLAAATTRTVGGV